MINVEKRCIMNAHECQDAKELSLHISWMKNAIVTSGVEKQRMFVDIWIVTVNSRLNGAAFGAKRIRVKIVKEIAFEQSHLFWTVQNDQETIVRIEMAIF